MAEKPLAILFVDDEANILSSIRRVVRDERFDSDFANSGAEALAKMQDRHFAVIVSDMKMPVMDGLQLLKQVKEQYPQTVRIVLSGYTQLSQVLATVNQADIFSFITKPWTEDDLMHVLKRALEYYQLKRSEGEFKTMLEKRNVVYQNVLKKLELKLADQEKQLKHIHTISKQLAVTYEQPERQAEFKWLMTFLQDYYQTYAAGFGEFELGKLLHEVEFILSSRLQARLQVQNELPQSLKLSGNYVLLRYLLDALLHRLDPGNLQFQAVGRLTAQPLAEVEAEGNAAENAPSKPGEESLQAVKEFIVLEALLVLTNVERRTAAPEQAGIMKLLEGLLQELVDVQAVIQQSADKQVIKLQVVLEKV